MKWEELTLKDRKSLYDNIRKVYPNISYLELKEQFNNIPEYEDGTSSTNLDEQWRKPVGGGMPRWEKANEDAKKLLSGLNKTIGTAFTGASLLTTGIWNAARILNIGKGSNWRLFAAKNALAGSKAGLAADIGNFIEDPSVTNAVQIGLSKTGSKDLTTTSNKIVNIISSGFDFDDLTKVPAYEDGIAINNSNTDYVKWKKSLPDNLKNESYGYDLYGAYLSGAIPTLGEDGVYHLSSRDPYTGKILKYPSHDTFYTAITEDIKQGYYPISKGNNTYTIPINPKEEYSIYR